MAGGKKYQIFISSTYLDLKEERQAVSRSILNLGHIPSGMEMFPASETDQITFIKKVIDDCDYYILIIGGRYGSLGEDGLSYTEKEFNYAVEKGIPVIAFVHSDIGDIKAKFVDVDVDQIDRLNNFRDRVLRNRLCKKWATTSELESSVLIALTTAFSDTPQQGWRRDTEDYPAEALKEINKLNQRTAFFQKRNSELSTKVTDYENLADSIVEIKYVVDGFSGKCDITGAAVIREFASKLRNGINSLEIEAGLDSILRHTLNHEFQKLSINRSSILNIRLFFEVFEIASADILSNTDALIIDEKKKYLLKAAFRPLKTVIDDELPF